MGIDRTALLTHPERPLTAFEADRFEVLLQRRLASEPIQYLTGLQEFYGLAFEVTPDVLIPRPETEHLVEAVLERFRHAATPSIVDVGTGSGAIAVSLAHAMPRACIVAVDTSAAALKVAHRNALRHGVSDRVNFLLSDLLTGVEADGFDAVVSNPPYIASGEILEPQVCQYEPHLALFAGPTGLEVYKRLIPQAYKALKPGGWMLLEIGHGQSAALGELLHDWEGLRFLPDLQGIARVAEARPLK
jgi:release factor glutamine methyltransferase